MMQKPSKKIVLGKRIIKYLVTGILLWSTQYGLADAKTIIQCYTEYRDRYSLFDGSHMKRFFNNNKPSIRLTISDIEVLAFEDFTICQNRQASSLGAPLYGWEGTVTPSKIRMFCEDIEWEPEKRRGSRRTLEIDRYTGKMVYETFGYSINNDDMAYPFTQDEQHGHCELAKSKF